MDTHLPKSHSKTVRLFYFWSGVIATFCYRAIIVITNYSPLWTRIFWYIGTIGFIIYFIHRYDISEKRAKLIRDLQLQQKMNSLEALSEEEKTAMTYILGTLQSSKEKWNYIFIFATSAIALILGIYLDFFNR